MNTLRVTCHVGTALAIGLACYWLGRSHVSEPPLPAPGAHSVRAVSPAAPPQSKQPRSQGPAFGSAGDLLESAEAMSHESDGEFLIKRFLEDLPAKQYASFAIQLTSLFPKIAAQRNGQFLLQEFARLWSRHDVAVALAWARDLPGCKELVIDALATELAETDAAAAVKLLAGERGGLDYQGAQLMEKWAQQDLPAALAALANMKGPHLNRARMALLEAWVGVDPQAAMAYTEQLSPADKRDCLAVACRSLCTQNPEGAIAWVKSLPPGQSPPEFDSIGRCVRGIFANSAHKDATLADSLLQGLPGMARSDAMVRIVEAWSTTDLTAAWSWAQSMTDMVEKNQALQAMAAGSRKLDAAATLALANEIPGSEARLQFLQNCCSGSTADPQKLAQVLQGLETNEVTNILASGDIVRTLSEADTSRTARLLMDVKLPSDHEVWKIVIDRWCDTDPAAAFDYISNAREPGNLWLATAFHGLAASDPKTALARAQAIQDNDDFREKMTEQALHAWFYRDPSSFEQAAQDMRGKMRVTAMGRILDKKIGQDPSAAATQWLSLQRSSLPEDVELTRDTCIPHNIGSCWVSKNPAQATHWAAQLPTEEMRTAATEGIAGTWAAHDSLSASKWIATLPPGPERDIAAAKLAEAISASDPQGSLAWAAQIQGQEQREEHTKNALRSLLEKSPEAGKQAVESSELPDKVKQNLLNH